MFTEMPSWVPLECIAQMPDDESDHFEMFITPQGASSCNGKLTLDSKTHLFKYQSDQKILPLCKEHLQKGDVRKSVMVTFQERATKATTSTKQTLQLRITTYTQKTAEAKQTQTLVTKSLARLPSLPKPLPKPITASIPQRVPPLPTAIHAKATPEASKEQLKTTSKQQPTEAKPLSKRSIESFNFPLHIKIDEKEEERRHGAKYTAKRISKIKKKSTTSFNGSSHSFQYSKPSTRPELEPPRIGIFALYYILTKIGILSDATSHFELKEDIHKNQEELDKLHRLRLQEMKKALESEDKTKRWGVSTQVFSWMGSFMAIITGVAMIMSGVGAIAGAMLLTSGLFMLTNHILMITGGWDKICDKLPGDDKQKKKAIVTWMQIGITLLCLILSGAGGIFGGFGAVGESMINFQILFGSVIMFAGGISTLGQGITNYHHRNRLAQSLKHKRNIERLKHKQEDLFEKANQSVERMRQLFKDLSRALDFEAELFRADQMVIGR